MKLKLKIGQIIYTFDSNRRFYKDGHSAPIYEKHFAPYVVKDETEKEYILIGGVVNKRSNKLKDGGKIMSYFTQKEKQDAIFLNEFVHKASEQVRKLKDANKLKKIIAILLSPDNK